MRVIDVVPEKEDVDEHAPEGMERIKNRKTNL